ncbi:Ubiquitin fusion degradation protein 4 [Hypsizygus marmoreus]|uniref:HECT-type E3 ubiquitin transferase n=1 Tax=Hypsizygus marmoreus TaxID=39966 RepID=A0A369JQ42_HYPMA|nr:Ubiquitin fusion degradation protein 4 [Hypsizygus marmoreus]
MDLQPIQHQEATSSASASTTTRQQLPDQDSSSSAASEESKALRSSARVKAAKQKSKAKTKGKAKELDSTTSEQLSSSSAALPADTVVPRTTRATLKAKRSREPITGKGKSTEVSDEPILRTSKRTRRGTSSASAPLTINEPVPDPKGKKRAAPEPTSDEEDTAASSSKRPRISYSLRSSTQSTQFSQMPRKTRASAKEKSASFKSKISAAGSSRLEDEDVKMMDADAPYKQDQPTTTTECAHENQEPGAGGQDEVHDEEGDEDGDEDEGEGDEGDGDAGMPSSDGPPIPGGMDETSAMAIFGDYRQFGSYMMSLSSRLKTMLNNIKPTADPTTRLVTLQELSELLSISTEDTLAGSFQVEQFVRELVKILGGRGADEDEDEDNDEEGEHDEDAALAAALAMSTGNTFQGDDNLEAQVLACRCLANLMEALPGVAHTVVYHGAIPVLCSKLIEISYIDLAEQTLSTMEKISEEFPSSIVREGGLAALLNYLDFFSIAVQRTALQAASNCCRNVAPEHFSMIRGVWPIIRNCLGYSDQRLVEFACLCVIRVVDSYYRASTENLESLVDTDLIKAVNQLLLPPGGSPLIAPNTYTLLLRALATSARASPKITVALLEADIVDTLYQILTGVLPSASESSEEQGSASGGQGLGGGLADMTVMENLAHRPKDQVEEALSLVSELMPPLPKDGVFDHKGYTEKSLARMVKAKAKADRAAARQAAQAPLIAAALLLPTPPIALVDEPSPDAGPSENMDVTEEATSNAPATLDRTEMLRSKPEVVGRFMQLMVPILIDVYAASVITPVRVKTMTGLLKAVSFLDAEGLKRVLTFVPVASFASSILSSKDHPSLVIGALQLVDLLLTKVPHLYKPTFRREGVFHEIEVLAERTITSAKSKEKDKDKESSEAPSSESGSVPPVPTISGATIPGFKKLSSLSLEPEDAITLRARVIQFKYLSNDSAEEGDSAFEALRILVARISRQNATERELLEALRGLAELFASPSTSVSSFELLQSGVVEGLLQFATDPTRTLDVKRRKEILLEAFSGRRMKSLNSTQTPFATLVKKLQESLTRMENFDVVTVAQGSDDSKRSSPSLLARQLRLRLVAGDDSDVPRNLHNIVVSIHAIATFQALHDYLRPRVAGLLNSGSRLHGMLAALAASGFSGANPRSGSGDPAQSSKPQEPTPAESSSTVAPTSSNTTVGRRRSQRLSAKNAAATDGTTGNEPSAPAETSVPQPQEVPEAGQSTSTAEAAPSETVVDSELQADFTDDEEIDADVFDDEEADPDQSVSEKTVMLSVAEDGSKVEAQTPDGTRVATPNSTSKDGPSNANPRASLSTRASYAAALKAKPTDWHLEFSMDDHVLPLDLTIYGAIHQHEMRKKTGALPLSMIWQGVYTVKFRKVSGPIPSSDTRGDGVENGTKNRSPSPSLSSLPEDAPHAKILRLLRVLHQLNTMEAERSVFSGDKRNLPESAFVNNKLTAKLTRQLEEPMIVASSCLPDWALDLPQHFPFIFPFATRYNFLQSTSFGYARLILKWQSQQSRAQDSSRRDEGIGFLGRLQRQKVRISRKHILESAVKVFELYGSSSSVLEVEYFEEVGTGLGPTLEFYSLVSKEFARKDLKLWRDSDATSSSAYVGHPSGLYPAPLSPEDVASDGGQKRTHLLRVIGQFVAKAMLDSRIIDLHFNKIFLKLVLGEEVPLTITSLKLVDVELANSLEKVQSIVATKNQVQTDKLQRKIAMVESVSIEDLALDFTIPGYDIELKPGGRDMAVTSENVDEYVSEVLDAILGKGTQIQAKAFRDGFSKVFPIQDLQAFSADELVMLFGNSDEDWSVETLAESLKADHGFNVESRAIHDLVEIMASYDAPTRRAFLQFITGSPKLPIGGFRGLNPLLTVVRKPHEAPLAADDYLPSVMTCVNYLKLPEYSSKAVMREKLRIAIQEGVGSFHLS